MEADCCRICLSKTHATSRQDLFLEDNDSLSLVGLLYEEVLTIPIVPDEKLTFRYICSSCDLQIKLFKQLKNKALESYLFLNDIAVNKETLLKEQNPVEDKDDFPAESNLVSFVNDAEADTSKIHHFNVDTNYDNEENAESFSSQLIDSPDSQQLENDAVDNKIPVNDTTEDLFEAAIDGNNGIEIVENEEEDDTNVYEYEQLNEDEQKDDDTIMSIEELLPENEENINLDVHSDEENYEVSYLDSNEDDAVDTLLEELEYKISQKPYEEHLTGDEELDNMHANTIDSNEGYVCPDCYATFALKSELKRHKKLMHPVNTKFKCPKCGKVHLSEETFNAHMNLHEGLPAYQCDECGKGFNQKYHYTYHLLHHKNERNIVCNVCEKAFLSKGDLKTHMRVHTKERRYKCDICDKTFRESTHVINHRYSHFEKQFECPECFQKYASPNTLQTHLKSVHYGEVPHACTFCEKKFKRKHHLQAHYKTHSKLKDNFIIIEE